MSNTRPVPINEERVWDKTKTIKSKTDEVGTITYVNNVFIDVSEYSKEELMGQPHNILRHPDMPKIIFKTLWDNLKKGNNFNAVVKNLTKTGKYYWIVTNFDIFKDASGTPTSFLGARSSVPDPVVEVIAPLYEKLIEVEASGGMEESEKYLKEYLADKGGNYISFIKKLLSDQGVDVSSW
ncbi:PAS domain-containing protein [Tenacibaculum tangerinum]|uniref:PAS domain-containing protein n=1 Tax=Tenacibaculum tangerinum TaxID=3038772 RepID=A0ABY8L4G7_9FLAO|nr:PAS domain-containing protein [Tenacibaculum tangerinum]WGH76159.1 PAS domain-containing protein [Tenacibaculum tangerinum]